MKKYNKKSYIRLFGTGILLLCTFSLVSVGFSAWYSGIGENQYAKVSLEVGDIIDKNSFFTFEGDPDLSEFDYIETAMLHTNSADSDYDVADPNYNVGYITIPFQMDAKEKRISDYLGTDSSTPITVRSFLIDKTSKHLIFNYSSVTQGTLTYSTSSTFDNPTSLAQSSLFSSANGSGCDFTINNFAYLDQSKVYFKARFEIKFTPTTNFKTDIYDNLDNGVFKFAFRAGVVF